VIQSARTVVVKQKSPIEVKENQEPKQSLTKNRPEPEKKAYDIRSY